MLSHQSEMDIFFSLFLFFFPSVPKRFTKVYTFITRKNGGLFFPFFFCRNNIGTICKNGPWLKENGSNNVKMNA